MMRKHPQYLPAPEHVPLLPDSDCLRGAAHVTAAPPLRHPLAAGPELGEIISSEPRLH